MALLVIEGFDHEATENYSQTGNGNQIYQKTGWSEPTEGPINFANGRLPYSTNSHSLSVIQNNPLIKTLTVKYNQIIMGMGVLFRSDVFNSGYQFFQLQSAGATVLSLTWDFAGRIVLSDHTGATVGTGTTQTSPGSWTYIELSVNRSGGTAEVRLNGVPGEIPPSSGNFGTLNIDTFFWEPGGLGSSILVDDFYALDPTTGINTAFLGDVVVETLYPISDGTYKQWTPDTGSTHYVRVDEGHLDNDTSYVHSTTAGVLDSYGMGNPTLTNTPVFGVQLNLGARKNDGGGRTIAPLIRQGAANYFGPITALLASYTFHSWLLDQDPTGATWLYTTVNNDEFGAELVS